MNHGLDFTTPNATYYGSQGGGLFAIQGDKLLTGDGRQLPPDLGELEKMKVPMGIGLRKAVLQLQARKKMAAERAAMEARFKEQMRAEEERLAALERAEMEEMATRFELPDLDPVAGPVSVFG